MYFYLESDGDINFVISNLNEIFEKNYEQQTVKLLSAKFSRLFEKEESNILDFFKKLKNKVLSKKKFIYPPVINCLKCNLNLYEEEESYKITAYCYNEPRIMYFKIRTCQRCSIQYSFRNCKHLISLKTFLYPSNIKIDYFATSCETYQNK